jgi:hypothetical protein
MLFRRQIPEKVGLLQFEKAGEVAGDETAVNHS